MKDFAKILKMEKVEIQNYSMFIRSSYFQPPATDGKGKHTM